MLLPKLNSSQHPTLVPAAAPRFAFRRRRAWLLTATAALLGGLPGCQSMDVSAGNMAAMRVIDVSPDAPDVDLYENGNAVAYNLGFGTVTSYIAFAPGTHSIAVSKANTRTVLASASAPLGNMHQYTALISNVNASLQETILQDQNTPAPANEFAVRILNEATKVGPVDVYLVPSHGRLSTSSPVATGLSFGGNTGYVNVPAGTYALAVVPADAVPGTSTLLTGSQITYTAGAVRTVVLIDPPSAATPGVQAMVADDYDPNGPTT